LTLSVLGLVLLAAATHALWNSWLKVSGDRLVTLATIAVGWAVVGLVSLPVVGVPEQRVWPYLLASTVVHTIYSLSLVRAYGLGNLSVVYPIARGVGPLVVAVVSTIYLGDALGVVGSLAVLLIVAGVLWLGLFQSHGNSAGVFASLLTGTLIGTYTILDGLGGRIGDSPHAFAAWLFMLTAVPVTGSAILFHRGEFTELARPLWSKGVCVGIVSAGAYWIVVWAMSVAPMGLVAAVRESSVVFAALIGGFVLREPVRWIAVILVFGGIVLTRYA